MRAPPSIAVALAGLYLRRPPRAIPIVKSADQTGQTGMAAVAVIHAPGDFAVMTFAAKSAFDQVGHFDVVAAGAHFEYFRVAHVAGKSEAVEPVGENDRPHAFLLGPVIDDHIRIFSLRLRHEKRRAEQQEEQPFGKGHIFIQGAGPQFEKYASNARCGHAALTTVVFVARLMAQIFLLRSSLALPGA
jgi:hypothetical protein